MVVMLGKTLWNYRGFIIGNVKREFQSKYRNSALGAIWNILNPLAMIIVYTVIFSQLMKARLPGVYDTFSYSIYLCAGILTWGLFSEIVSRGQGIFIEQANVIKKINFPRMCLPVIIIFNALVNFTIVFVLFTIFLIISNEFPGMVYFCIIPVLLVLIIFAIGLGVLLGIMNVFFRDVGHFFGIFLQFWFWFTPIVYSIHTLPERIQNIISLNPLYGIITASQTILVNKMVPSWQGLLPGLIIGLILCLISIRFFRKYSGEMVDEL
ncbi:lipopolysaccharide transport system permease [Yersinia frederiksenii]|nr:lipopolysaccharide transport system permease [Yersinia frederiksenii]